MRLALFWAIFCGSVSLFAADREWNLYLPGNGACYIKFPANPEYQTQMVDAMATHIYVAKDLTRTPAFVYTLGFADYAKEKFVDKDSAKKLLDTDRDSFAKAVNGKIVSEKPVKKEAFSGRLIVVSGEEGQARYVLCEFLVDTRVFQLSVCVPASMQDDPDVAKFFDSFQLPKK